MQSLREKAEEIGLDSATTKTLIEKFVELTAEDIRLLKDAVEKGEWVRMREISHHIKGAAVNLNLTEIREIGERIEALEGAPEQSRIAELIEDMEKGLDRVRSLHDSCNAKT